MLTLTPSFRCRSTLVDELQRCLIKSYDKLIHIFIRYYQYFPLKFLFLKSYYNPLDNDRATHLLSDSYMRFIFVIRVRPMFSCVGWVFIRLVTLTDNKSDGRESIEFLDVLKKNQKNNPQRHIVYFKRILSLESATCVSGFLD